MYFIVTFNRGRNYETQFKLVQADHKDQAKEKFMVWFDKMCADEMVGFTYERARGSIEVQDTIL